MTCTDGNNRKTEKSVKVEIAAQNNNGGGGGGGGSFDWLTVAALTLAAGLHIRHRRAARGSPKWRVHTQMADL